ncbi:monovalent cation/H(+) antiporter subunit G [Poriferisphaera sp. WC338]|uniref:monovalent cation/H(+) antiporter subunit G n=1 Tax=Poriferisphaera sp. WC338 TaxID=3425129 RepID=UPI003D8180CB
MIDATLILAAATENAHGPVTTGNGELDSMTYMLVSLREFGSIFFLVAGLFFMFVGALGVFRLPDVFHRMHASSKCSTLGLLGLMLAVIFNVGTIAIITKATLTIVFAFAAIPVGSHLLAKASLKDGAPKWRGTIDDEWHKSKTAQNDMD